MSRFSVADLSPKYAAQAQAQMYATVTAKKTMSAETADALGKMVAHVLSDRKAKCPQPVPSLTPTAETPAKPVSAPKRAKGMIRQNSAGLNKTEQAFKDYLARRYSPVLSQSLTLRIANGCRYTPDFVTFVGARVADGEQDAFTVCAYEVKGFMRDDAAVKLKVAASLYPWISFFLVSRKKGEWIIQEILP